MVAPGLPSSQSMTVSKVEIAAIDPDFVRGSGRHLNQQSALERALTSTGFDGHGLTCLAITS